MINLDANNPSQVSGARILDVDLGQANRRLMIFSGIAIPQWSVNDDEHTYRESCTVNLRRTVLAVDQATVSIGLASIGNDDTTFLFAADNAGLDIDPVSQELLLKVDMALQGEHTGLARFGYQVVTTVTTQSTGISGRILWNRQVFDAAGIMPNDVAQMFRITANHVDHILPPPGSMQFGYDKYTPLAYGVTTGFSTDHEDFVVPYEIPGAPYNQDLVVSVDVGSTFRSFAAPSAGQVAGPKPVRLTVAQPGVTGVDFRVVAIVIK